MQIDSLPKPKRKVTIQEPQQKAGNMTIQMESIETSVVDGQSMYRQSKHNAVDQDDLKNALENIEG